MNFPDDIADEITALILAGLTDAQIVTILQHVRKAVEADADQMRIPLPLPRVRRS